MAAAVWQALSEGKNLVVEAGTGVGKSLAYLVPAALWASATGRRVAVSTYTRLLQTQLINQDVPLLRRVLAETPEVAVAYGQENYLCRFRLHSRIGHGLFETREEAAEADRLLNWAGKTEDGVLLNYPYQLWPALQTRISRDSSACRARNCPYFSECFYFRGRSAWAASSILIVNHALFFAGLATEPELLPKADAVIFDEAHRLEEAAARHFGCQVSQHSLIQVLDTICPGTGRGLIDALGYPEPVRDNIAAEVRACRIELDRFFTDVARLMPPTDSRLRLNGPLAAVPSPALEHLADVLAETIQDADEEELATEIKAASRRLRDAAQDLLRFAQPDPAREVQWVETITPGRLVLLTAPLAIDRALAETVYPGFASVIMTSATMTVARDFSFLAGRLGLEGFSTLLLDSPFDYSNASLLFTTPNLPEPSALDFAPKAAHIIADILRASRGRALVLFTSYDTLNRVSDLVPDSGYTHLRQGELPTPQLLERFRADVHSVLFATQSFWQGIDVPGEALSCLIICRLPFDVPDEPRLAAICERLREQGTEPFRAYQLPSAILRFRQGFGRLIRTKRDRGVVCVLDRRILSRGYGRLFLASLPPDLPRTNDLSRIATFLAGSCSA